MKTWIGPLVLAVVLGIATYFVTLHQTPTTLMATAVSRLSKGGVNSFSHAPLATDKSRAIVRPSPDLAYSSCPFDLSQGPVSVSVPPVPARYWSLSVFQADTDVAFVRNNIEAGGQPIAVTIAEKGQAVPAGATVVRVKGAKGVALIRILIDDRATFPAIDRVRQAARCGAVAGGATAG